MSASKKDTVIAMAVRFVALNSRSQTTRGQLQQAIDALTKAVRDMQEPEIIKAAAE